MTISIDRQTSVTQRLAEFVCAAGSKPLDASARDHALQALLDLFGIAIRASHEVPASHAVSDVISDLGLGDGPCTILGRAEKASPTTAAFLNGVNFHALDFDDTHETSSLHPGAPVVAAALAEAEVLGTTTEQLLNAIVVGYDVAVRIGLALNPASCYARGFHPTAIAGVFGATAAIASVYECSPDVLVNAFGINLSQAAGSLQFSVGTAETKALQVGLAAHNAVLAVRLARAGLRGPSEALEGRSGLLHGYSDLGDPSVILDTWDGTHEIERTAFKPYPCCRYMHAAIDLIASILGEHHLGYERIDRIRVGLPVAGIRLCGEPQDIKRAPRLIADAQFSMYYTAAATAVWGSVRWADYARLDAPEIKEFIDRVDVEVDPDVEALSPQMAASVEISAGEFHEKKLVPGARGEPANPLSWEDLELKFRDLTADLLSSHEQDATIARIRHNDGTAPAAGLLPLSRRFSPR